MFWRVKHFQIFPEYWILFLNNFRLFRFSRCQSKGKKNARDYWKKYFMKFKLQLIESLFLFIIIAVEIVHLTSPPHIFSVEVKSGACYTRISGGEFWIKLNKPNPILTLTLKFLLFFIIKFVFILISVALSFLQLLYGLFYMSRKCQLDYMYTQ